MRIAGSEYPVVIMPLFMQHFLMLSRNLFYTGLTRARKLAIIVGESKAISLAVKQVSDRQRYTYLAQRLAKFHEAVVSSKRENSS